MTEMFGEAWPPMSVPDLAPDDDDEDLTYVSSLSSIHVKKKTCTFVSVTLKR